MYIHYTLFNIDTFINLSIFLYSTMAYTMQISLKKEEFDNLNQQSEKLKLPKSRLIAKALEEYYKHHNLIQEED
jgi:hypothetical protein